MKMIYFQWNTTKGKYLITKLSFEKSLKCYYIILGEQFCIM